MVVTLLVPARALYRLERVVTTRHLDNIGKMLLVMGWIVTYAYVVEIWSAWYSGDTYEMYTYLVMRPHGPYAWLFWGVVFCNCISVQALWSRRIRTNGVALWIIAGFIQLGMWGERFMLIITSESRDFLPSSWRVYAPTLVDGAIFAGTVSFFLFLFLLFLKYVPFIPIFELKELRHDLEKEARRA
jgi:molybdopterin-containing oxidoreductase family membrane subunit